MRLFSRCLLPCVMLAASLLSVACRPAEEPDLPEPRSHAGATAGQTPEPPDLRGADAEATPAIGRAAPPMLQPVVLGEFVAADASAQDGTGRLRIEDTAIRGANGVVYVTERIAVIRAGDEYADGARYADVLMVGAEQAVELRRVVEETPPKAGVADALCGAGPTGYLALARIVEPDGREALRMVALRGEDVPAPTSADTHLCRMAQYLAVL